MVGSVDGCVLGAEGVTVTSNVGGAVVVGAIVEGSGLGLMVGLDELGSIVGSLVRGKVGEGDGRFVVGTLTGFDVGSPVEGIQDGSKLGSRVGLRLTGLAVTL